MTLGCESTMVCVDVIWCMLFSVNSAYASDELNLCCICSVLVHFRTPLGLTFSSSLRRGSYKVQYVLVILSHRKAFKINYTCNEFFTNTG